LDPIPDIPTTTDQPPPTNRERPTGSKNNQGTWKGTAAPAWKPPAFCKHQPVNPESIANRIGSKIQNVDEISAIVVGTGLCEKTNYKPKEQTSSFVQKNWEILKKCPFPPHKNPCESDSLAGIAQKCIGNHKNLQQECVYPVIDALQIRSKESVCGQSRCNRSSTTAIGQQLLCPHHFSLKLLTVDFCGKNPC
jgi:hypothetical protein